MPRAKRYYIPGYIWHITDRCINKEFLLRFREDRQNWMFWMRKAKSRFDINILNYAVTSNHIHVLMENKKNVNAISKALHLTEGRTAQDFNIRKSRRGPFWEDRYNATAVESGTHLMNCMVYIDMNMVRARVVSHPKDWPFCGYQEISGRKSFRRLINKKRLAQLLEMNVDDLQNIYEGWIQEYLEKGNWERDKKWTESLAVGGKMFVDTFRNENGVKVRKRCVKNEDGVFILKEDKEMYRKIGG